MSKNRSRTLEEKYPPSEPCSCGICLGFCRRPGWWTVDEAEAAIKGGYGHRMMLEISPEMSFGVISPAFRGCEGGIALNIHAQGGCSFLVGGLCQLHGTGHMPLECRFCHHDRMGAGGECHADIEKDWNTPRGQKLIKCWGNMVGLWDRLRDIAGHNADLR